MLYRFRLIDRCSVISIVCLEIQDSTNQELNRTQAQRARDLIPVDSRRRKGHNSQKSLTAMTLFTNRYLFPSTNLAQNSPSWNPSAHHYGGGLNQAGSNSTPEATTGLGP